RADAPPGSARRILVQERRTSRCSSSGNQGSSGQPPEFVLYVGPRAPAKVQAVVAPAAHAVLPEEASVFGPVSGAVDHIRDRTGPHVEGRVLAPAPADLTRGVNHEFELGFRARNLPLNDLAEVA